jgi:hypothetical protein
MNDPVLPAGGAFWSGIWEGVTALGPWPWLILAFILALNWFFSGRGNRRRR